MTLKVYNGLSVPNAFQAVLMTTLAEQILAIESELQQLENKRKLLLQRLYDLKTAQNAREQKSNYSTLEKL